MTTLSSDATAGLDSPIPIQAQSLRKQFGAVVAVDDLSFEVAPGRITGLLGPNGSGKTTTLRMLVGLVSPSQGSATIFGRPYRDLPGPPTMVGAALEASGFHPGRSGRDHLHISATMAGSPIERVDEVLGQTGIADAADRRVGGYSLGMRQRLALATALLGSPRILLLDEPANGLDPGGIAWLREFLRWFAADGGTVLISSHLLSEVAQTVDDVLIIARGRLVKASPLSELIAGTEARVVVVTPTPDLLLSALRARQIVCDIAESEIVASPSSESAIVVHGLTAAAVGDLAHSEGIRLHQLTDQRQDLEDVFLRLVSEQPT